MANTTDEGAGGFVERLKGKAKQVAGNVLDDDLLKTEGHLQEAKVDAGEEAKARTAEAEAEAQRADLLAREKEISVERQRLATEEAAETREAKLERERLAEEQRIEREHAAKEAAVERQERAQEAAIASDEMKAAQERSIDLREASALEAEAERARATADALDRATKS